MQTEQTFNATQAQWQRPRSPPPQSIAPWKRPQSIPPPPQSIAPWQRPQSIPPPPQFKWHQLPQGSWVPDSDTEEYDPFDESDSEKSTASFLDRLSSYFPSGVNPDENTSDSEGERESNGPVGSKLDSQSEDDGTQSEGDPKTLIPVVSGLQGVDVTNENPETPVLEEGDMNRRSNSPDPPEEPEIPVMSGAQSEKGVGPSVRQEEPDILPYIEGVTPFFRGAKIKVKAAPGARPEEPEEPEEPDIPLHVEGKRKRRKRSVTPFFRGTKSKAKAAPPARPEEPETPLHVEGKRKRRKRSVTPFFRGTQSKEKAAPPARPEEPETPPHGESIAVMSGAQRKREEVPPIRLEESDNPAISGAQSKREEVPPVRLEESDNPVDSGGESERDATLPAKQETKTHVSMPTATSSDISEKDALIGSSLTGHERDGNLLDVNNMLIKEPLEKDVITFLFWNLCKLKDPRKAIYTQLLKYIKLYEVDVVCLQAVGEYNEDIDGYTRIKGKNYDVVTTVETFVKDELRPTIPTIENFSDASEEWILQYPSALRIANLDASTYEDLTRGRSKYQLIATQKDEETPYFYDDKRLKKVENLIISGSIFYSKKYAIVASFLPVKEKSDILEFVRCEPSRFAGPSRSLSLRAKL